MMHLVTPDLDRGPVITYCSYSIQHDSFDKHWKQIEKTSIDNIKRKQFSISSY